MKTKRTKSYFTPDDVATESNNRIWEINRVFATKIEAPDYPCVGAKSAIHTHQYRLGIYGKMGSKESTMALAEDLKTYIEETVETNSQYMSMIAVFTDELSSELDFEQKLWLQLQKLHDSEKDKQPWDPTVSDNPEDNDFSFSFNRTAFFVVGVHPCASRRARRFEFPAMVFNLHGQFEQLRGRELYEKMKHTIREREIDYDGAINPMLRDYGDGLEAPQYSGRKVDENWKCPFHR